MPYDHALEVGKIDTRDGTLRLLIDDDRYRPGEKRLVVQIFYEDAVGYKPYGAPVDVPVKHLKEFAQLAKEAHSLARRKGFLRPDRRD